MQNVITTQHSYNAITESSRERLTKAAYQAGFTYNSAESGITFDVFTRDDDRLSISGGSARLTKGENSNVVFTVGEALELITTITA